MVLTAERKVLQGEEGRTDPIWSSSLSSQELLRVPAAEICGDSEPPETSGHERSETIIISQL